MNKGYLIGALVVFVVIVVLLFIMSTKQATPTVAIAPANTYTPVTTYVPPATTYTQPAYVAPVTTYTPPATTITPIPTGVPTSAGTAPAANPNPWTMIAHKDIAPGQMIWQLPPTATLADAKALCIGTPGCVAFVAASGGYWGKDSTAVIDNPDPSAVVYILQR